MRMISYLSGAKLSSFAAQFHTIIYHGTLVHNIILPFYISPSLSLYMGCFYSFPSATIRPNNHNSSPNPSADQVAASHSSLRHLSSLHLALNSSNSTVNKELNLSSDNGGNPAKLDSLLYKLCDEYSYLAPSWCVKNIELDISSIELCHRNWINILSGLNSTFKYNRDKGTTPVLFFYNSFIDQIKGKYGNTYFLYSQLIPSHQLNQSQLLVNILFSIFARYNYSLPDKNRGGALLGYCKVFVQKSFSIADVVNIVDCTYQAVKMSSGEKFNSLLEESWIKLFSASLCVLIPTYNNYLQRWHSSNSSSNNNSSLRRSQSNQSIDAEDHLISPSPLLISATNNQLQRAVTSSSIPVARSYNDLKQLRLAINKTLPAVVYDADGQCLTPNRLTYHSAYHKNHHINYYSANNSPLAPSTPNSLHLSNKALLRYSTFNLNAINSNPTVF
jgi:hypothetical protein